MVTELPCEIYLTGVILLQIHTEKQIAQAMICRVLVRGRIYSSSPYLNSTLWRSSSFCFSMMAPIIEY